MIRCICICFICNGIKIYGCLCILNCLVMRVSFININSILMNFVNCLLFSFEGNLLDCFFYYVYLCVYVVV